MASRGVNKVIIVGNLGKDPEMRYMPNGGGVANFTVATSETWKDKQTGEQKEKTEWHRIVIFGRLAEIAGEYLRKGSKVYIEGRLETRKWTNQQGQEVYTTEINAHEMQMLDSRGQGQGAPMGGQSTGMGNPMQQNQGGFQPQAQPQVQPQAQPQSSFGGQQQPQQSQGGFGAQQQVQPSPGGFGGAQQPQQGGFGQQQQSGGFGQQQPQGGFGGAPQQGGFSGGQPQQGGFAKPASQPQQAQQAEPPIDFDDDIPF